MRFEVWNHQICVFFQTFLVNPISDNPSIKGNAQTALYHAAFLEYSFNSSEKRVQNPVKSLDFKKSDDIQVQKPNTT